jgi:sulfur relay (sulfurtransferase) complex TusBCD TusD component (DsrE family)
MGDFLAIAVTRDGVSQDRTGKERMEFENMLQMLLECEHVPATLCFYTEGVRWLSRESPAIDKLEAISKRGAKIIACRACMAQAGLIEEMSIGQLETEEHVDEILRHAEHAMVL